MRTFTRTRNRMATLTAVTLVSASALAACGLDSGDSSISTLRVATIPGISSLPVQVAVEKGFFEKHGIDVEITGGLDVAAWQSAVGKQFDIVLSNASSYTQAAAQGLENELLNNMVSATADFGLNNLAANEPIGDLSTLRGRTIGVPTLTGLPTQMLIHQLTEAGLRPNDYKLVQMAYNAQADNLRAGNVDAVMTAKPYEVSLANDGFWVSPDDICVQALVDVTGGEVNTCSSVMFVANAEWAAGNNEQVQDWVDALEDAVEFIETNPDDAVATLQDWVGYSDELAADVELPKYSLAVPEEQLEPVWQVLTDNGAVEGAFPNDTILVREG